MYTCTNHVITMLQLIMVILSTLIQRDEAVCSNHWHSTSYCQLSHIHIQNKLDVEAILPSALWTSIFDKLKTYVASHGTLMLCFKCAVTENFKDSANHVSLSCAACFMTLSWSFCLNLAFPLISNVIAWFHKTLNAWLNIFYFLIVASCLLQVVNNKIVTGFSYSSIFYASNLCFLKLQRQVSTRAVTWELWWNIDELHLIYLITKFFNIFDFTW